MSHIHWQPMLLAAALSLSFVSQGEAQCAKCTKIEEARAKEKAANPQPAGYYDESIEPADKLELSMNSDIQKKKDSLFFEENAVSFPEESGSDDSKKTPPERNNRSLNIIENKDLKSPSSSSGTYSAVKALFNTRNFLETLDGPFTLFIPTNQAFSSLSSSALIALTRPENNEALATLVSNHVVGVKILKKDFLDRNQSEIKAISGKNLTLSHKNGQIFIDNAQILSMEPAGNDGVIYVIDKILTP